MVVSLCYRWSQHFCSWLHTTLQLDRGLPITSGSAGSARHTLCATWLGHAGFLLEFVSKGQVIRVLCDPIFADRASPSKHFGPKRRLPPPCSVEDLPEIHFLVISHNHYDHLDVEALRAIHARWPDTIHYFVPMGVNPLLGSQGLPEERIHSLDWWERKEIDGFEFICAPAQHNSGRGILDQGSTLWSSWVIRKPSSEDSSASRSVWFAGDTGYQTADGPCPAFQDIGNRYGPFDLALIPIWRGASLSFLGRAGLRLTDDDCLATLHATPEDALQIQRDVKAHHAIGMHFATFAGSQSEAREPVARLAKALRDRGEILDWKKEGGFGIVNVGERHVIPVDL